jgi:hypothetical protein
MRVGELGMYSIYPFAITKVWFNFKYEACPENNDTKVLNMYNSFNLQKRDIVNELPEHNFIFQHIRRHCPNIY